MTVRGFDGSKTHSLSISPPTAKVAAPAAGVLHAHQKISWYRSSCRSHDSCPGHGLLVHVNADNGIVRTFGFRAGDLILDTVRRVLGAGISDELSAAIIPGDNVEFAGWVFDGAAVLR